MRQDKGMEDNRSGEGSGAPMNDRKNGRLRMIAIAVTAIALLAISIPFVFQAHPDDPALAEAKTSVTPVTSHDIAGAETPSCMADAKPANWDFKLKDLEGKEVSLSSFKGKVVLLN